MALVITWARGPYWLGSNFDPAYAYLLNSLLVAEGRVPHLVQHPGTPVEILGAAVLRVAHASSETGVSLEQRVLRNPESCIRTLVLALLLLYGGALVAAGHAMLRATGSVPMAWLVQATPLFSHGFLFDLADFKPEPLLCAVSALVAGRVAATIGDDAPSMPRLAVALGFLAGAGVATKYNAVSLCAGVFLLRGLQSRALFVGAAAASFLVFTAPAWAAFSRSLRFVWRLASGSGLYGMGSFPEHANYYARLRAIGREEVIFFLVILTTFGVAVHAVRKRASDLTPVQRATRRALLVVLAVEAVQIGLLLKQPYQSRYLMPALGLAGLNLALAARLLCWDEAGRLRRIATAVTLACLAAIGAIQVWRLSTYVWHLREMAACQKRTHRQARQESQCVTALYYRSSAPAMALRFGDFAAGGAFADSIRGLYPRVLFLDDLLKDPGYPKLTRGGPLPVGSRCVVFQGSAGGPAHPLSDASALRPGDFPVDGRVETLFSCGWYEAVYRVDLDDAHAASID